MNQKIAKNLTAARKKMGKSQADVCKELNIPQSTLGNYEQGTRVPRDGMKVKLAKYYGTTVEALFFN